MVDDHGVVCDHTIDIAVFSFDLMKLFEFLDAGDET